MRMTHFHRSLLAGSHSHKRSRTLVRDREEDRNPSSSKQGQEASRLVHAAVSTDKPIGDPCRIFAPKSLLQQGLTTCASWMTARDVDMSQRSPKHAIERHMRLTGAGTMVLTALTAVSSTGRRKDGQPEQGGAPAISRDHKQVWTAEGSLRKSLPNLKNTLALPARGPAAPWCLCRSVARLRQDAWTSELFESSHVSHMRSFLGNLGLADPWKTAFHGWSHVEVCGGLEVAVWRFPRVILHFFWS